MTRFICLLRGINIGKHNKIKMADLRAMFTEMGVANVKTLLATGNIAFDSETPVPAEDIQAAIQKTFGFEIATMVHPQADIQALVARDPFADVTVTPETRLHVTFLPNADPLPFETPFDEGRFTIIHADDLALFTVLVSTPSSGTPDFMQFMDKTFGKLVTTRTWNTVQKIATL